MNPGTLVRPSTTNRKKPSYLTTIFCLDCETLWEASNISNPCPKCASREVISAARWAPARYGMPGMPALGKAGGHGK